MTKPGQYRLRADRERIRSSAARAARRSGKYGATKVRRLQHDAAHDTPENGKPEGLPNVARTADLSTTSLSLGHPASLFYNQTARQSAQHEPVLREGVRHRWTTRFAQLSRSLHNV